MAGNLETLERRGFTASEYMHVPDAVVRTFLGRTGTMLSDVVNRAVFGRVKAYVGVHEFTTSLLPHFHLAVILNEVDRPVTPDDIDALVSCEIPSEEDDPELFQLVMSLMMHRPCDGTSPGYENPPGRVGGGPCRHGFPFHYQEVTVITGRGPILRRRDTGEIYHRKFDCPVSRAWCGNYVPKMLKRHKNHFHT